MDFIDFSLSCRLLIDLSKSILENSDTLIFDKATSPAFIPMTKSYLSTWDFLKVG